MSARLLELIDRIAEALGHGVTGRTASVDFGPTPAARYPLLALYSDSELYRRERDDVLAEVKALHADARTEAVR